MRTADALVTIARLALEAREAPMAAGQRPHVTLVVDLPALRLAVRIEHRSGSSGTAGPTVTSLLAAVLDRSFGAQAVARLTCDASITPLIVGELGQPLAVGRASRLSLPHQTRTLWVRDGGGIAPGCGSRHVQVHHLVHWAEGGTTDVDCMCLVCERHHHLVHDDGWQIEHGPHRPGLMRFRHPIRGVRSRPSTPATATPAPQSPIPPPTTDGRVDRPEFPVAQVTGVGRQGIEP